MAVRGELPEKRNQRGGAGWWMDPSGAWRPPEEWPENSAPFDGWERGEDGRWHGPDPVAVVDNPDPLPQIAEPVESETSRRLSRQARADRRAVLTVFGAIAGAALLLVVALILITQAGATGNSIARPAGDDPEVIYAANTDADVQARLETLAAEAPGLATAQLASLARIDDSSVSEDFEASDWTVESTNCLTITEEVLVERSAVGIVWADQFECVPDRGRWTDRYLGTNIRSVIEADVQPLVPASVVHVAGGSSWTAETRAAYLTDTEHLATLHIVAADGGHNPREQAPDEWRPSNRATWCAYAIDWVGVKVRWDLGVTEAEASALEEMLESCGEADSNGADTGSLTMNSGAPTIELVDG